MMKKIYLLMPGFPAVARYYKKWAREIENKNPSLKVIYARSDILFSKRLNFEEYNQAMIAHYEKILLKLTSLRPITVIAHSTGGYFTLKLLEKYPERIKKVILIYPYVGNSSIKAFKFLKLPYLIDRFLPLSETILLYIIFLKKYFNYFKTASIKELYVCLRFGFKQNTYFNKFNFNTNIISKFKNKIVFFYTNNDRWCTDLTIQLLRPVSTHKKIPLAHDFILYRNQRIEMIKKIEKY